MKTKVRRIAFAAICAASAFILDYFSIRATNTLKITLYALPLVMCSIYVGCATGSLAGLVEGIIVQFIFPVYPVTKATPLWLIAPILWGLLPGLIYKLFKNRRYIGVIISIIISALIVTVTNGCVSYLDGLINEYGVEFTKTVTWMKLLWSTISASIYCVIICLLYRPMNKLNLNKK